MLNGADTHPTVRIAFVVVEFTADDVALTMIVSPELVVPVRVVNGVLLILYSPPTTETTACALMPDMVTGLDVYTVESSAAVTPEKVNAVGVVSAGRRNAKSESWLVVNVQSHRGVITQLPKSR